MPKYTHTHIYIYIHIHTHIYTCMYTMKYYSTSKNKETSIICDMNEFEVHYAK